MSRSVGVLRLHGSRRPLSVMYLGSTYVGKTHGTTGPVLGMHIREGSQKCVVSMGC